MSRVSASAVVPGRAPEAEALWLDRTRWASWVDGLARVVSVDEGWPEPGARLRWASPPRGRGLVAERVVAYEPGRRLDAEVEDERLAGTRRVEFAETGGGTRVTLALEYRLKRRTAPLAGWFVRRALRDSLRRTLARFGNERRAELG